MRTDPDMLWYGWGDPAARTELPESAQQLLASALRLPERILPPPAEEDVKLPATELPVDFAAVVGEAYVLTDPHSRLLHSAGKSTIDLLRLRSGEVREAPDAVLLPADHDEILTLLRICTENNITVVPFGGGTSVVGGVQPSGQRPVVALDLRRLDKLVSVDEISQTAVLQAGLRAPAAERLLGEHGFTLGHLPQSFEYATIGGFAATRSSGQASNRYGSFADLVTGLRVATPSGPLELGRAPGSAAGPDLLQLLLGSEGVFGVITEVTVRIRPIPPKLLDETWTFADFASGVAAVRALAQADAAPAVARLSDEAETGINRALGGQDQTGGCVLVTGYEGTAAEVAADRTRAAEILAAHGGSDLAGASDWRAHRFRAPYLRDALLGVGALAETLETAATYSALPGLYEGVRTAVAAALGGPAVVMCHVSHLYPTGASLYFTVVCGQSDDPVSQWQRAKTAAGDAIVAAGGTITHHHAVGADHRPWMAAEVGDLGVAILRAVKDRLDPAGILNPGKLIP
ncbi:FAD-binding oxidoreductase [Fodinicola feengrottensis]|uniref:FAD-binding oxidoreductase n=1 Tax=Fodinicola feengrottensis TaxID=435914 RepID=A0ABN2GSQ7_9ACTN|nr:FAD-binding oxidoreductase [Fodinicola feengrottensis]